MRASAAAAGRAERLICARATPPAGPRSARWWPAAVLMADQRRRPTGKLSPQSPSASCNPEVLSTFRGRRPMAGSCRVSRFGNVTRWRVKPRKQD
jgi:hypothetical protein